MSSEGSALALALLFRLEAVGVSVASAVAEGLAAVRLAVVVPGRNAGPARPRIHAQSAHVALLRRRIAVAFPFVVVLPLAIRRSRIVRRFRRGGGGRRPDPLAALLALVGVVEPIGVALTSAVVEFVARVPRRVVVPLAEGSAARTHHSRQDADVCRQKFLI